MRIAPFNDGGEIIAFSHQQIFITLFLETLFKQIDSMQLSQKLIDAISESALIKGGKISKDSPMGWMNHKNVGCKSNGKFGVLF